MLETPGYIFCGGRIQSFDHPAQARRFPRFAKRKNFFYKNFYESKDTDGIVIVTQAADFTFWSRIKSEKNVLIFDANDPYLLENSRSLKTILRGLFKFVTGNHKYLEFDYRKSFLKLCMSSDCVIVGHYMLYERLKPLVKNVVLIPDYSIAGNIEVKSRFELEANNVINIFWEGLGSSYLPFADINRIFKPLNDKYKFVFHFVTDLSFFSIGDKFNKKYIFDIAKKDAPEIYKSFRFYQWSEFSMNKIAVACDFAIITLPLDSSINYFKPENKLIHMWRMAVPTIVTAIPSYVNVMNRSGQNDYCNNDDDWRRKLLNFIENQDQRQENANKGWYFVNEFYSNERIDIMWTEVFKIARNEN
jgi:hypothetical protein